MLNFYRRMIPKAPREQAPLHELLKGAKRKDKRPVTWTPETKMAFENCKDQLASATTLVHPLMDAPLELTTDASNIAMGATLSQWQEGSWKPIGFFSRKLAPAQQRYSTYDRELQAIYSSLKYFRHMIEARPLVINTDHKSITFAFKQKAEKASPRQQRQLEFIGQFCTDIRYVPGTKNIAADTLSRVEEIQMPVVVNTDELAKEQVTDDELQQLLNGTTSLQLRKIRIDETDSALYCDVSGKEIRPYIPRTLRKQIFNMVHSLSHPSGRATKKQISQKFVWPKMTRHHALGQDMFIMSEEQN